MITVTRKHSLGGILGCKVMEGEGEKQAIRVVTMIPALMKFTKETKDFWRQISEISSLMNN